MSRRTWTLEDGNFVTLETLGDTLRIAIEGATASGDYAIFAAFMPLLEAEIFLKEAEAHVAATEAEAHVAATEVVRRVRARNVEAERNRRMFYHTWALEGEHFVTLETDGIEIRMHLEGSGDDLRGYPQCTAAMSLLEAEAFLRQAKEHAAASTAAPPGTAETKAER